MALERHPVDGVADDLILTYRRSARRLENIIRDALRRGLDPDRLGSPDQRRGDATAAYRARQLQAARAVLADLERHGAQAAPAVTRKAYASSILALDHVLDPGDSTDAALALAGRFGGIHQRQVGVIAGNLERALSRAAATAGANVEVVFARAAAVSGGLSPAGIAGLPRFIGRREDDAWRRLALEAVGEGTVAGDVRRQVSATLARRLVEGGVTDALTGFVDQAGRRWALDTYTEMAVRTVTREASSRALVGRMNDHGEDLVAVTAHPHVADVCTPYDGKTFSLSGSSGRYPRLDRMPPFHPRCRHALGPAELLDEYERELGIRASAPPAAPPATAPNVAPVAPAPRPRAPRASTATARPIAPPAPNVTNDLLPAPRPPDPPFSDTLEPRTNRGTRDRLEAQRIAELLAGDPGPEPGARDAWEAAVGKQARDANRALNVTLGPDMAKFIDLKWGKDLDIRGRLLRGELSIDEAHDLGEEAWAAKEYKRSRRELAKQDNAFQRRQIPCFVCGRFKRRPADVCDYCGDDPVSVEVGAAGNRANEADFNRGYGFAY